MTFLIVSAIPQPKEETHALSVILNDLLTITIIRLLKALSRPHRPYSLLLQKEDSITSCIDYDLYAHNKHQFTLFRLKVLKS